MVAISLYRGNLHRVPDVPRRWLMPSPKISLKDFKTLLNRRNDALSRLRSTTSSSSNPNPNSNQNSVTPKDNNGSPQLPQSDPNNNNNEVKDQVKELDGEDSPAKQVGKDPDTVDEDTNLQALQVVENPSDPEKPTAETIDKADVLINDKVKRKRDVEDELEVLNAKKHKLVLVLKQILNVEEELKRRNSMAIRPSVTLQADATNDSGSITRHAHRMGSEANLGGDMEGGEADDASNQNMHSRHMIRMSSTSPSPSSESPLRRPTFIQHNVMQVPLPSRATTLGATSSPSPSRFAPMGHQGHPGNLPTVSVSGTNYVASSPSPAASGGTSVFRDARQPSPWN